MLSLWLHPKGVAVLSLTRGHSSFPVSCCLCLLLLPVGRSRPLLLSPVTNILVRHGSLDGILQGFFLEIANPELWLSRQQKDNHKPKTASDIKGMSRQFSQCPQPRERPEHESAQRDEEQRLMLPGLDGVPLSSPCSLQLHRSQIRSVFYSFVVFCVVWTWAPEETVFTDFLTDSKAFFTPTAIFAFPKFLAELECILQSRVDLGSSGEFTASWTKLF